ncbi:hypothetical protein HPB47_011159 [Ixodes persulcatus]|uniref:Uncharacterized protein n=1 Tax=Ixodes persulcatus TaxID=34615 RepID=A0AC60NX84_IXOPE|nr:hypothetical protein HPB47_011159 [Ixodes persulcatus]
MMGQSLSAIITFEGTGPNLSHPRTGEHCRDASRIQEAPANPTGHNTTPTRSAKIDDPAKKISVQKPDEILLQNTGIEKATLASTSLVESPHNATPNLQAKRSEPATSQSLNPF